jgi:hypothetical protein
VTAGETSVPVMHFPWGRAVGPFGVGSLGDWAIRGEGVLDVHLLVSFDGERVHVAPARAMNYVAVNGQVIDERWWAVPVHSEIQFGSALLHVGCEEMVGQPGGTPPDDPMTSTVPDGGRLRRYAEGLRDLPPGGSLATPDFGTNAAEQSLPAAPGFSSPPARAGDVPTPRPAAGAPPPERLASAPAKKPAAGGVIASWRATSLPMKLTLVLLPLAAAGLLYTWDDVPPSEPVRRAPRKIASPSAKAVGSAAPASSLANPAPAPSETAAMTARPSPTVSSTVLDTASAAPLAPAASLAPLASAKSPGSAVPSSNVARAALEATFAGQLGSAQTLYERLAAEHPDQPVFRSAAAHVKAGTVRKP